MNDEVKFMTIDAKGRMMVPKNSILGKSENILIARENDITFSLHDLIVFNGYIEKLKIKREKAFDSGNSELFEFINDKINFLMFSKFGISNSDNQNRILIPQMVREMYELKDKVLLCNGENHIKVFNGIEKYEEYEKKLVNSMK